MFRSRLLPHLAARLLGEAALPAGRYFGVPVEIHASGIFVAVIVAVSLGASLVPLLLPDHSGLTRGIVAAALTGALAGSILVHEIAHAIAARRTDLGEARVTLYLFGGAVSIPREPAHPSEDLRIAVAGPTASVSLALVFTLAFTLLRESAAAPPAAFVGLIALVNAGLALLNLFPAYPLDGGRVLRSMLWRINGSRTRSTRLATRVTTVFALSLLVVGAVVLSRGSLLGIGIAFLGWFLGESAGHAAETAQWEEEVERRRVSRIVAAYGEGDPSGDPASADAPPRFPEIPSTARPEAAGSLQAKKPKRKRTAMPVTPPSTPKSPPVQRATSDDGDGSTTSNRPDSK